VGDILWCQHRFDERREAAELKVDFLASWQGFIPWNDEQVVIEIRHTELGTQVTHWPRYPLED
jgi:hypothetical protein